jgi:hypothetical protein
MKSKTHFVKQKKEPAEGMGIPAIKTGCRKAASGV